jgi:glucokinase
MWVIFFDNTRVCRTPGALIWTKTYQNTNFDTFADVLRSFFKEAGVREDHPPITACIAVAGPVSNNAVTMTNRDGWVITGDSVTKAFGIREVSLINDFLAIGYGLMALEEKELVVLQVSE